MDIDNEDYGDYMNWARNVNSALKTIDRRLRGLSKDMFKYETSLYLLEKKLDDCESIQNNMLLEGVKKDRK